MNERKNEMSLSEATTYDSGMKFKLPEELISGVVHRGHLMQVLGPHAAGKSCLMIELAEAIANGVEWLGFKCQKGNVLYINADTSSNCWFKRLFEIHDLPNKEIVHRSIVPMNPRKNSRTLDKLLPKILSEVHERDYAAIIIDSLQSVFPGDEDDAFALAKVSDMMEKIREESGATLIYVNKNPHIAYDLDSDTNLEINPVAIENKHYVCRCEFYTRYFPEIKPFDVSFEYPVHRKEASDA